MSRDYSADFHKILEQLSISDVQGTETPAADLLNLNMSDSKGRRFTGTHLRGALRAGEAAGYGSLIVGRRGYPTRFAWSKVPAPVIQAEAPAAEPEPAPAPAPAAQPAAEEAAPAPAATAPAGSLVHKLQLRGDVSVEVTLPADLTAREAERLAHWMQALPFC